MVLILRYVIYKYFIFLLKLIQKKSKTLSLRSHLLTALLLSQPQTTLHPVDVIASAAFAKPEPYPRLCDQDYRAPSTVTVIAKKPNPFPSIRYAQPNRPIFIIRPHLPKTKPMVIRMTISRLPPPHHPQQHPPPLPWHQQDLEPLPNLRLTRVKWKSTKSAQSSASLCDPSSYSDEKKLPKLPQPKRILRKNLARWMMY